jgi:predicted MarR family transcription regulator
MVLLLPFQDLQKEYAFGQWVVRCFGGAKESEVDEYKIGRLFERR